MEWLQAAAFIFLGAVGGFSIATYRASLEREERKKQFNSAIRDVRDEFHQLRSSLAILSKPELP